MKKQSRLSNWSNPQYFHSKHGQIKISFAGNPTICTYAAFNRTITLKSFFPSFLGELSIFFKLFRRQSVAFPLKPTDPSLVLPDQACARFSWIAFVRRPAIFSCGSKIGCAMFIHAWTYPKGPIGSIDLLYALLTMHQLWQEWKQLPNGSLLDATSICSNYLEVEGCRR